VLGNFLGFAITARRRAASFDFYRSLGFEPVPVGDASVGPYAAFSDGVVAIGLYDALATAREHEPPPAALVATFVRPDLQSYVRAYRRLGIELEIERLASDEFNEVGFSDPSGQPLRVLEARTFSPGPGGNRNVCACGAFLELSIATRSTGHSQIFWEALGFKAAQTGEEPYRWRRLTGHGLTLGLYEGAAFPTGLSFRASNLAARAEYLKAKGFEVHEGPFGAPAVSAMLVAPEGTRLYLLNASPASNPGARASTGAARRSPPGRGAAY
jgi:hypothetical protein